MWARVHGQQLNCCQLSFGASAPIKLRLDLPSDEIQPLFSGGAWAGTQIWTASLFLADYLHANRAQFAQGKHVLELGAGVGVPGLAAAWLGASSVLLSEQAPLDGLLARNVQAHALLFKHVSVQQIDWLAPNLPAHAPVFDTILVSDCIYEHLYGESWRLLANVIRALRTPHRTTVLNCVERRNGDGVDKFLAYCDSLGLRWELVVATKMEEGEEIELYRLGGCA
jgi:predicted nicotinamide N-methyase